MTFDFTFPGYDAGKLHVQDPIVASTTYQMASIYADGRFTNDKSAVRGQGAAAVRPRIG